MAAERIDWIHVAVYAGCATFLVSFWLGFVMWLRSLAS